MTTIEPIRKDISDLKDDIKTLIDNNFDLKKCKDILFYIDGLIWENHNIELFIK